MLKALSDFAEKHKFRGKGPLCVALVVTDHARERGLPLDPAQLITEGEGQVLGLGKGKVQAILGRHGITRVLAEEGGRTSRGSLGNMRVYVEFLNKLSTDDSAIDLNEIELFWIARVRNFFAAKPFSLKLDGNLGLRAVIRNLMRQAEDRQREMSGTMFLGTMLQHLVGAKLDLVLGEGKVQHHGSNQNDAAEGRTGDFNLHDVSIHVSTAPSEALIRKCVANLDCGLKPLIITTRRGATTAEGLSENAGIYDRLDIIEFEQFLAANIYELGQFSPDRRIVKIGELLERYNAIVDAHETDPSLKIEIAKGR
ncbi:DUF4928 family protein [Novispirillum itersonii]|uniref:DUF4928 domain-containing protein n=1 Tax=Novispirillum itersonii TaxID=189 RepID=A0A7X0DL18_NOVIT|nr:DUF4928 family protein [Novispirillum itersonii]MBB6208699.1 hypothetical protein [Novispirillum itersonii]